MKNFLFVILAALPVLTGGAVAAERSTFPPYALDRTQMREMTSETGAEYRIYVSWPKASPPDNGYPVLYILDGDDAFAVAAKTAERFERFGAAFGIEPGIVVGIGYPGKTRRSIDYTPRTKDDVDGQGNRIGGAEAFRAFLRDSLMPAIEADFDIDARRQSLMGHSYGGLFTLDVLFEEPSLFNTYIASSPSIWFGDRILVEKEKGLAARLKNTGPRKLVLTVGELEQTPPPGAGKSPAMKERAIRIVSLKMVDDNKAMAERLREIDGLNLRHRVFSGENHGTSSLPAIAEAIGASFLEVEE